MKEPQSPCLFCDERHIGCHIGCGGYKLFKKQMEEYKEHITEQKIIENQMEAIEIKRFRK